MNISKQLGKHMKILFIFLLMSPAIVSSGPAAYGTCQTACNAGVVLCYTLAGLVYGASAAATGPFGWMALAGSAATGPAAACSAAQGVCMAGCVPLLIAPTA